MIIRNTNPNRFLEVVESMPKPKFAYYKFMQGVPSITALAVNEGGVCLYRTVYGGLMGLETYENKLISLGVEEVYTLDSLQKVKG